MPGGYLIRKTGLQSSAWRHRNALRTGKSIFEACKTQLGVEAPFSTDNYRMNTAMLFSESFGIGSKFYVDSDNTVKYAPFSRSLRNI